MPYQSAKCPINYSIGNSDLKIAGEIPLSIAYTINPTFPYFLDEEAKKGEKFTQHYVDECCRIVRDFFEYCKVEYGARYKAIKPIWIKSIVAFKLIQKPMTAKYYSLNDMYRICAVQAESLPLKRIKAAAAFLFLSGMRIRSFLTLPIECVNLQTLRINQDPSRGVYTKLNKAAVTSLYGIKELLDVVREWDCFARANCPLNTTWYIRFYSNYRLNPQKPPHGTRDEVYYKSMAGYKQFCLDLHKLCDLADVDYINPHGFRYRHTHFGLSNCQNMEEMKAVSLNLMHNSVSVTDTIYSRMNQDQVNTVISSMGRNHNPASIFSDNSFASPLSQNTKCDEKTLLLLQNFGKWVNTFTSAGKENLLCKCIWHLHQTNQFFNNFEYDETDVYICRLRM